MMKDPNNKSRSASHVSYVPGIVLGASQMFHDHCFTEEEVGTGWLSGSQDVRQGSRSLPSAQPLTTMMVRKHEQTGRVWCAQRCCWGRAGGGTGSQTGRAWLRENPLVPLDSGTRGWLGFGCRCPWSGYCKGGG